MEKEAVTKEFNNPLKSTKEFILKTYERLTDNMECKEKKLKHSVKMAFAKYGLVFLSIFYLLTSMFMINGGIMLQILNSQFYSIWTGPPSGLEVVYTFWIANGVILLCVALFGLIGAFRKSIIWYNIFAVLMTIVFILQISSAIAAFSLIGSSRSIASDLIGRLYNSYKYSEDSRLKMDLIQKSFKCCGKDEPSDWNSKYQGANRYSYIEPTTESPRRLVDLVPASCCNDEFNYNYLSCDKHYQVGCVSLLRETIAESVLIIGSVALVIGVLDILGIVLPFIMARLMRKNEYYRDVQLDLDQPNCIDGALLETATAINDEIQNI